MRRRALGRDWDSLRPPEVKTSKNYTGFCRSAKPVSELIVTIATSVKKCFLLSANSMYLNERCWFLWAIRISLLARSNNNSHSVFLWVVLLNLTIFWVRKNNVFIFRKQRSVNIKAELCGVKLSTNNSMSDFAGGSVAEWSARQTRNPAVPGSSPALATCWICARSSRVQSSAALVNSPLVASCQLGFLILLCCIWIICF